MAKTEAQRATDAAYSREYRKTHPEEVAAYQKVYRAEHRPEINAQHKTYRAAHPEEITAYWRGYRSSEQGKAVHCAVQHRRNARKRGALGADYTTAAMIKARCEVWDNKCWICGAPMEAVDHVKPLCKGGAHLPCNLRPICWSCNSSKNGKWPYNPERKT